MISAGRTIAGKYKLVHLIGEGGMGVVWSAINIATAREVALKLITRPEPELRLRLKREARNCGALRHRNVVDIYDMGETESGEPFLVMQLLSGETVAEVLVRKRRIEPEVAAAIGRDVARGLASAHRLQIVHRDLKPANIFLHREAGVEGAVVKVLDFGVAKNLAMNDGLHTMVGGAVGSPLYMSPEQVRAEKDVDCRADVWALGVVLFEMLTGVRPFQGDAPEVFKGILSGEIPTVARYLRRVDPGLVDLVARCMRRSRDERFGSAEEVAARLEEFVTGREGASGGPGSGSWGFEAAELVVADGMSPPPGQMQGVGGASGTPSRGGPPGSATLKGTIRMPSSPAPPPLQSGAGVTPGSGASLVSLVVGGGSPGWTPAETVKLGPEVVADVAERIRGVTSVPRDPGGSMIPLVTTSPPEASQGGGLGAFGAHGPTRRSERAKRNSGARVVSVAAAAVCVMGAVWWGVLRRAEPPVAGPRGQVEERDAGAAPVVELPRVPEPAQGDAGVGAVADGGEAPKPAQPVSSATSARPSPEAPRLRSPAATGSSKPPSAPRAPEKQPKVDSCAGKTGFLYTICISERARKNYNPKSL